MSSLACSCVPSQLLRSCVEASVVSDRTRRAAVAICVFDQCGGAEPVVLERFGIIIQQFPGTMMSRYRRFSAAPALSLVCSNLPCKNLLARVGPQLAPIPTAAVLSPSHRSFGSSCCPPSTPATASLSPPSVNLDGSGPLPSFLMNRAIRYSQVRSATCPISSNANSWAPSYR
jgi:hypothetical protein